jgi:hypothetical protein
MKGHGEAVVEVSRDVAEKRLTAKQATKVVILSVIFSRETSRGF